jgi:hypothetical protein
MPIPHHIKIRDLKLRTDTSLQGGLALLGCDRTTPRQLVSKGILTGTSSSRRLVEGHSLVRRYSL